MESRYACVNSCSFTAEDTQEHDITLNKAGLKIQSHICQSRSTLQSFATRQLECHSSLLSSPLLKYTKPAGRVAHSWQHQ